jgi:hypothetical protein
MSEPLQFIIVVGFGALCFVCGFLTSLIVTRKRWRGEMIKRGMAHYNSQTGAWEMIERGVTRYNPQTGVWEWSRQAGLTRQSPAR